jgi:hypothetical protein
MYRIIIILFLFLNKFSYGQACCTAGTPLLGSLEMTSAPMGMLQIGLTTEHNSLTHVLSGNNKLDNPERERISQSALVEVNYGITNRLSVTGLFSYIRQQRTITNFGNTKDILTASGIGDIAFLTKYSLITFDIFNKQELSIGLGLKFPVGKSTLKNNSVLLPADMQPGSGSWDGLIWGYYSKGEILHPDLTFLGNISYRFNGSNKRFSNSNDGYSFGNEFIGMVGVNYLFTSYLDFTLLAKFRNTKQDSFGNNGIPNTGGNWMYIVPGVSYYLTDKFSTRIDGELPLFRNVSGTQLTTTFTVSLSLFYSFNLFEGSLENVIQ